MQPTSVIARCEATQQESVKSSVKKHKNKSCWLKGSQWQLAVFTAKRALLFSPHRLRSRRAWDDLEMIRKLQ